MQTIKRMRILSVLGVPMKSILAMIIIGISAGTGAAFLFPFDPVKATTAKIEIDTASVPTTADERMSIDEKTMMRMKEEVAKDFLDPDSARFRGVVPTEKGGVLCGFVNAKNRFGGYVGFRPFAYNTITGKATTYDPPGDNEALFKITEIGFKQAGCERALGAPLLRFFL